jgi:hypothetical protein
VFDAPQRRHHVVSKQDRVNDVGYYKNKKVLKKYNFFGRVSHWHIKNKRQKMISCLPALFKIK